MQPQHDRRHFLTNVRMAVAGAVVAAVVTARAANGQVAVIDRVAQAQLRDLNQEADRITTVLKDIAASAADLVRTVGKAADGRQVTIDLSTIAELRKANGAATAQNFETARAKTKRVFYAQTATPDSETRVKIAQGRQQQAQLAAINAFAAAEVAEGALPRVAARLQELARLASESKTLLSDGDVQTAINLVLAEQGLVSQYLLIANTKLMAANTILSDDNFYFEEK